MPCMSMRTHVSACQHARSVLLAARAQCSADRRVCFLLLGLAVCASTVRINTWRNAACHTAYNVTFLQMRAFKSRWQAWRLHRHGYRSTGNQGSSRVHSSARQTRLACPRCTEPCH
jgi:hypothetical protein